MTHRMTSEGIKKIAQMFKECSPDCLSLYFLLKNSLKTDNTWPKVDVYVDSEDLARLTSVVITWYPHDDGDSRAELWYFLYSLDSSKLKALLRTPGLIAKREYAEVNVARFKYANDKSVGDLFKNEFHMTFKAPDPVHSYVIDNISDSITNTANRQLPENFKIAPLQLKHGKVMHAEYWYGDPPPVSRFENTIKYQQHLAIYNEKGDPISWAVVKEYGDIGMTYTVPDYRRQGFASILTAKLVEMLLESNEIPFITISRSNEASVALHTKLGFERRGEEWTFDLYHQNTS